MRYRALLLFALIAPAVFGQPQNVSVAQWRSDIDYLAAELPKRHPNPFSYTSRADFVAQLEAVKADVPQLSDIDIALRLQQAVASLRDAHTEVNTLINPITFFPLVVYRFSDGFFVTRTTEASRNACGARIVAIDGMGIDDVLARYSATISYENDQWLLARTNLMMRAETLYAIGVTASRDHARFTFERQGASFDLDLAAIGQPEQLSRLFANSEAPDLPMYRQQASSYYWSIWEASRGLLYVKYNSCQNDPRKSFSAFASEVFAVADGENVQRFVVDIRNNGGGNSSVVQPLIDGLALRPQLRGKLYGIIGRATFSSGLMAAFDLLNRGGATLVGEPTGGKPNAYGEVLQFPLPATRLMINHSTKYFTLAPGDPPSLEPLIQVSISSSDYFANRDPVLEAMLPSVVGGAAAPAPAPSRRRAVPPVQLRRCE